MNYIQVEEDLIRDEGVKLRVYRCTAGHKTIGVGHKLSEREILTGLSEISLEQAGDLLHQDIGTALNACYRIFGRERFDSFSEPRQRALVNMAFQLGHDGLKGFREMIRAVTAGDWARAHTEALNSKWARLDSPARARRVAFALRSGVDEQTARGTA
jgi:lysozyme